MMNRNHLALFRAVAEAGGFSRAAETIHVSQPAISMQVGELEASLETLLFERLPARRAPDGRGRDVVGLRATHRRAGRGRPNAPCARCAGLQRGRLTLGASTTIGNYLLPTLLGEFRRRYPAVELALTIGNTDDIQQRLIDRTLDLGLTEGAPPVDEALSVRTFAEDELIVIAAPGHAFAARAPGKKTPRSITSRQLCAEPMIVREPGSGTREVIDRALAAGGAQVGSVVLTLSSTEAIKRAVAAGLGLAVVSRLCVTLELAGALLVEVPVRGLKLRRPLHELTLRGRQPGPPVRAFVALLARSHRP